MNNEQIFNNRSIFDKIKDNTFESMRPRVRTLYNIYTIKYRKIIILKYRSIIILIISLTKYIL